jgi:hypothetical protein
VCIGFQPYGIMCAPLILLVPLGFGGLVVCVIALAWRPRWPAITGLTFGLGTLLFWAVFFGWSSWSVDSKARVLGLTGTQHEQILMSAQVLALAGEQQRQSDGSPPRTVYLKALSPTDLYDPWGRAYRYKLATTPRGFTFFSDGADGVAGTADDIDIFAIQADTGFPLPAISPAAKPPMVTPTVP